MPVTWSFDVFFDLRLNKRLSKQSWGWWFEMPWRPLWRHFMRTWPDDCRLQSAWILWLSLQECNVWLSPMYTRTHTHIHVYIYVYIWLALEVSIWHLHESISNISCVQLTLSYSWLIWVNRFIFNHKKIMDCVNNYCHVMFVGLSSNVSTWGQFHKKYAHEPNPKHMFGYYAFKITTTSPIRGANALDAFVSPKPRKTPSPIVVFQMQCNRDINFTGNTMIIAIIEFLGDFQPGGASLYKFNSLAPGRFQWNFT